MRGRENIQRWCEAAAESGEAVWPLEAAPAKGLVLAAAEAWKGLLLLLLLEVSKMLSCVRTDCVVLCVVLLEVHAELEMLMADGGRLRRATAQRAAGEENENKVRFQGRVWSRRAVAEPGRPGCGQLRAKGAVCYETAHPSCRSHPRARGTAMGHRRAVLEQCTGRCGVGARQLCVRDGLQVSRRG